MQAAGTVHCPDVGSYRGGLRQRRAVRDEEQSAGVQEDADSVGYQPKLPVQVFKAIRNKFGCSRHEDTAELRIVLALLLQEARELMTWAEGCIVWEVCDFWFPLSSGELRQCQRLMRKYLTEGEEPEREAPPSSTTAKENIEAIRAALNLPPPTPL